MSWPIGPATSPHLVSRASDGAILLGGVRVTDTEGWLDVEFEYGPRRGERRLAKLQVRLRVSGESDGAPFLYVDELISGGRRFASVLAAIAGGDDGWAEALAESVHREMETQHRRFTRASSAVHRVIGASPTSDPTVVRVRRWP